MKVPRRLLAQTIANRTLDVQDNKDLAREIAAYLLCEHRTNELESILRDVMQYRSEHGVLEAEVVSAHEITQQVEDEVKQILHRAYPGTKTVHVDKRVDASVIGGIRIDMANEQLDMSVAAKLAIFKRLTATERN